MNNHAEVITEEIENINWEPLLRNPVGSFTSGYTHEMNTIYSNGHIGYGAMAFEIMLDPLKYRHFQKSLRIYTMPSQVLGIGLEPITDDSINRPTARFHFMVSALDTTEIYEQVDGIKTLDTNPLQTVLAAARPDSFTDIETFLNVTESYHGSLISALNSSGVDPLPFDMLEKTFIQLITHALVGKNEQVTKAFQKAAAIALTPYQQTRKLKQLNPTRRRGPTGEFDYYKEFTIDPLIALIQTDPYAYICRQWIMRDIVYSFQFIEDITSSNRNLGLTRFTEEYWGLLISSKLILTGFMNAAKYYRKTDIAERAKALLETY